MKIVIDTNCIIAALIRDSVCRKIILHKQFTFISPDFVKEELMNHKEEIRKKTKVGNESYDFLLKVLFENIMVVPREEYNSKITKAKKQLSDVNDVPFLALAIVAEADAIWSDDKGFKEQDKVRVLSTKEIIELL